ncbi:RabGAP/TBC, partial [Neoconidiobolus thromboides FSU 785]
RELRHLARAGIPARFRAKLWFECSGGSQMNEIGYYQGLIMKSIVSSSPFKPQIELDIHRTMPNNTYFSSEGQGVEKLYRILLAYSIHNPSVGYCQSMNLIAATLLLVLPTEEEVFWTLAAIIEHVLPLEYFTSTLLVSQADQRVLKDFVSKYLPRLNRHFDMLGVDLGAITFNWFLSLFTSCAPFPLVLRIWDVFLIEGDATLFRISLAMLELNMDNLLRLNSSSSIYNYLK